MAAKGGGTKLGFWLMSESRQALEIARLAGFELVILDMEHGALSAEAADALIPFAKGLGLVVMSRVAAAERVPIQKALDSGADGVILPQIRDVEHARVATAYAKYPPLGTRGLGLSRIDGYGRDMKDFVRRENRRTVCLPMIETPGALADADAIARLETVDGLFLGPSDLSLTRGRGLLKLDAADFRDTKRVADAARKAGKLFTLSGGSDKSRRFAVRHRAAFVGAADELSAMTAGFTHAARPLPKA
jgi:2-dehydro-3-deoxyglucarate aldolase/4-hydroxy-2-oxoheptanedioate aldolase